LLLRLACAGGSRPAAHRQRALACGGAHLPATWECEPPCRLSLRRCSLRLCEELATTCAPRGLLLRFKIKKNTDLRNPRCGTARSRPRALARASHPQSRWARKRQVITHRRRGGWRRKQERQRRWNRCMAFSGMRRCARRGWGRPLLRDGLRARAQCSKTRPNACRTAGVVDGPLTLVFCGRCHAAHGTRMSTSGAPTSVARRRSALSARFHNRPPRPCLACLCVGPVSLARRGQ
jgi:hypothetical protein